MNTQDVTKIKEFMFYNFVSYTNQLTEEEKFTNDFDAFKMTETLSILLNTTKQKIMTDYLNYYKVQKQLGLFK